MPHITQLLGAAASGDPKAAADLLPLVYAELRKLAASRMTAEPAGNTLTATALVHEAYLGLVGDEQSHDWNGRGHLAEGLASRGIVVLRYEKRTLQ